MRDRGSTWFLCTVMAVLAVLFSSLPACAGSRRAQRVKKAELAERIKLMETPGLVIGEFPLAPHPVVDGDTIKVQGLRTSLRLIAIDTEETFKNEEDRRLYEMGFEEYLKAKKGNSLRPVKVATPLGEEAKKFAEQFFKDVELVRLERDHPKEIRDRYNRYLAYVFALKDGQWVNYNVECVRAGMSPYFTKYSYSRRFHDLFVTAQKEAQQARRGIWDPAKEHYRDYPERLEWWEARAEFIRKFEREAEGKDNYIKLDHWDAVRRIELCEGKDAVLLGTISEIRLNDRGPHIVLLGRRQGQDFPLVFFDKDVFGSSGIGAYEGEYVVARGRITRYRGKRGREQLQMIIKTPGQIVLSRAVPNYSGWDTEGEAEEADRQGQEVYWEEGAQP
jgi:endonuclease YncB( thermonuclease family)